ncbi:ATP synthase F1 subunit epsilon [Campylobacter sp. 19-13652]|uniref:ATP synthase F1 subunit epsilon n=1 Tax=Campylobacter sp. 19-13652 TaxID=2840180 RepID=UPI001C760200|nr:ATP synthase F1 subunit epsilon [Campylobacter sp. 19-13652]BCX78948.1 ATP synthase epsilon chain [Campylobacter sp. 19-13652]
MDKLHLEIVTPEGLVFSGDVASVVLPGSDGEFGVLPRHAALISLLQAGVIDITGLENKRDVVAINWGYAEVDEHKVTVLADGAVYLHGSDDSELAINLTKAKELISAASSETTAFAATIAKLDDMARSRR